MAFSMCAGLHIQGCSVAEVLAQCCYTSTSPVPSSCVPPDLWYSLHIVTADSPLGRGLLTGTIKSVSDIKDFRSRHPRFQEEELAKVSKAVRLLLGLLRCCQRAPCIPAGSIGHGQSCRWEGGVGLVGFWLWQGVHSG